MFFGTRCIVVVRRTIHLSRSLYCR